MERSKKPIVVTAGRILDLSLDTFIKVSGLNFLILVFCVILVIDSQTGVFFIGGFPKSVKASDFRNPSYELHN